MCGMVIVPSTGADGLLPLPEGEREGGIPEESSGEGPYWARAELTPATINIRAARKVLFTFMPSSSIQDQAVPHKGAAVLVNLHHEDLFFHRLEDVPELTIIPNKVIVPG